MKDRYKILILGSSAYTYTESDPKEAFPALLEGHLSSLLPEIDWKCDSEIVYTTLTMPPRVRRMVHQYEPDIVVLKVSSMHFARSDVINVLRRKAPFLFRPARSFAQWLRDVVGGGGPRGAETPRGWLYRAPRWVVERLIGSEPTITVEDAIEVIGDTVDELLKIEDLHVLVGIPSDSSRRGETEAGRKRSFRGGIVQLLADRRLPYYISSNVRKAKGLERKIGPDGWHSVLENRTFNARTMAEALAYSLQNPSYFGEIDLLTGASVR